MIFGIGVFQFLDIDYNMVDLICQDSILKDVSNSGRERPWHAKKKANELLCRLYKSISTQRGDYWDSKAGRLKQCATWLTFDFLDDGTLKLANMPSCRVRLCPMCAWRRTLKISSNAKRIFTALETKYPDRYTYLFLTLTVPNCKSDKLSATIDSLMTAFDRLMKRREVKSIVKGWYRGLEVTHNRNIKSKSYDTYHPHYHVVLVVDKSYLEQRKVDRGYITQKQWQRYWAESLGYFVSRKGRKGNLKKSRRNLGVRTKQRKLSDVEAKSLLNRYNSWYGCLAKSEIEWHISRIPSMRKSVVVGGMRPADWTKYHDISTMQLITANRLMLQVDVRSVKPKHKNLNSGDTLARTGLINAICETTKYTVKDKDYIVPYDWDLSKDIVCTLDMALADRRLIAWGGLLARLRAELKLDDEIDGDLVHIDDDSILDDTAKPQITYFWHVGYQQYISKD